MVFIPWLTSLCWSKRLRPLLLLWAPKRCLPWRSKWWQTWAPCQTTQLLSAACWSAWLTGKRLGKPSLEDWPAWTMTPWMWKLRFRSTVPQRREDRIGWPKKRVVGAGQIERTENHSSGGAIPSFARSLNLKSTLVWMLFPQKTGCKSYGFFYVFDDHPSYLFHHGISTEMGHCQTVSQPFCPIRRPDQGDEKACVVICHGNACCRLDAFHQVGQKNRTNSHNEQPQNVSTCGFVSGELLFSHWINHYLCMIFHFPGDLNRTESHLENSQTSKSSGALLPSFEHRRVLLWLLWLRFPVDLRSSGI